MQVLVGQGREAAARAMRPGPPSHPSADRRPGRASRNRVDTSHATVTGVAERRPRASRRRRARRRWSRSRRRRRRRDVPPPGARPRSARPCPEWTRNGSGTPSTSASPLARAISTIATPPGRIAHSASTGSPSGPVTLTVRRDPPTAASNAVERAVTTVGEREARRPRRPLRLRRRPRPPARGDAQRPSSADRLGGRNCRTPRWIWRCHIDLTDAKRPRAPSSSARSSKQHDASVWTMPQFVPGSVAMDNITFEHHRASIRSPSRTSICPYRSSKRS